MKWERSSTVLSSIAVFFFTAGRVIMYAAISSALTPKLRGWGPDSGRLGRFMKAVKLFSDPTKTKIYKRLAL